MYFMFFTLPSSALHFQASFTLMHRTCEHFTDARLSFSGRPHTPVNMADSMEEVMLLGKKK